MRPDRLLASLLRRVAGPELASDILGDLEELQASRAVRGRLASAWSSWAAVVAVGTVAGYFAGAAILAFVRRAWPPSRWVGRGPGDFTVVARSLRRSPWFAATVIGVIALTTALATTVFAVVDGILFKPLPFPDAGQLLVVRPWHRGLDPHVGFPSVSPQDLADWRTALPEVEFTGLRTASATDRLPIGDDVNAPEVEHADVDGSFLSVLRQSPIVGAFVPEHFTRSGPGVPRAALLTHDLWAARFGADPTVVGRTVVIDEPSHLSVQIVGVLPAGFVFPAPLAAQLLLASSPAPAALTNPRVRLYDEVIARLPAGLSPDVVRQRIEHAMRQTAARFPPPPSGGWAVSDHVRFAGPYDEATLVPLDTFINARQRPLASAVFVGSVALVLLGCVNVAGLMAARGRQRDREVAVRRALGAGRLAIARFVFTEAVLATAIGTALGVMAAWPMLGLTAALLPDSMHLLKPPTIDWRVLVFAFLMMACSALVVAGGPIRQALRSPVATSLRGGSPTPQDGRLARLVIAVQVALGLTLAVGGALLVGSLITVWSQSVGFNTDVTMVSLILQREPSAGGATDVAAVLERVRALPGIEHAGVTDAMVLKGATWGSVLGPGPPAGAPPLFLESHAVTSGFFEVMTPRLVEGRYPTAAELDQGAVLVVTEAVAKAYWPGRSALGESLAGSAESYRVVGVVADARYESWDRPSWVAYGSYPSLAMSNRPNLLVRSSVGRAVPVADILRVIADRGPAVRATRVVQLDALLTDSIRPRRFESWLFGSFAVAALLVVSVGVLGIVGMATARRTREVGIRMALGSTRNDLVGLLLREQLMTVAGGLAAGGVLSAWAVQFVKAYMYILTVHDPRLWAAAVVAILLAACLGTAIPALRASHVDPVQALRSE